MEINLNDIVYVKLTEEGRNIHYNEWKDLHRRIPMIGDYISPEDSEGWSRWQLWSLMQLFGPFIRLGMNPPFEGAVIYTERPK